MARILEGLLAGQGQLFKEKAAPLTLAPAGILRRRSHITSEFDTLPSTFAREAERSEKRRRSGASHT